jgi:predicted TIM-barrel fold metal-dependent hydrolase
MRVVWFGVLGLLVTPGCHRQSDVEHDSGVRSVHQKFDVHLHIGHNGILLAEALMDREGEVGGVNLSGRSVSHGLEESLAEAKLAGGRILVFANIDFRGFGEAGWTEREVQDLAKARDLGARGLKVFKSLGLTIKDPATGQRVHVDDPRLAPIFEEAGALGFPVAIHTGDPKAFFQPATPANERWSELQQNPHWSFNGPGFPTWDELYAEFENLVRTHPHTTFIGVHFGNDPEDPAHVSEMLDRYPNLLIDTAARVGEIGRMDPDKLRSIFIAHRTRILFGTDWGIQPDGLMLGAFNGWREELPDVDRFFERHARFFETRDRGIDHPTPIQGNWKVDGVGLPADVLSDLYLGNAERLFGWRPVPWPAH